MGEGEDKATDNREQSAKGGEGPFLEKKRAKKNHMIQMKVIIITRGTQYLLAAHQEFKYLHLVTPGDGDDRNNSGGDPAQGADRRVGGAPTGEENILC